MTYESDVLLEVADDLDATGNRDVCLQLAEEKRLLLLAHGKHVLEDGQNHRRTIVRGNHLRDLGGRHARTRYSRTTAVIQVLCKEGVRVAQENQPLLVKVVPNAGVHQLRHLQELQQLRGGREQLLTCEWYFSAFLLCV